MPHHLDQTEAAVRVSLKNKQMIKNTIFAIDRFWDINSKMDLL